MNRPPAHQAPNPYAANWPRNRIVIIFMAIFGMVGFHMVIPFLPLYVQELGVTDPGEVVLWSGIIVGTAPFVAAAASPFWGVLSDRVGMKPMLQRAFVGCVVLFIAMGLSTDVWQLFIARLLFGLVGGFNALLIAVTAANAPRDRVTESVGFVQGVQLASTALGPAIGGFGADVIGLRQAFFLTAGFYALCLVACTIGLIEVRDRPVETSRGDTTEPASSGTSRTGAFRHLQGAAGWIVALAAVVLVAQSVDRSMGPVIPVYVSELGTPPGSVASISGLVIGASGLFAAASATIYGRLGRRVGVSKLLVASLIGGTVFSLLQGVTQTVWQLFLTRSGMTLMLGGVNTLCYSAAATSAKRGRTAATVSILSSAIYLGAGVGPLISGAIGFFDLRWVFIADGLLLLAAAAFVLVTVGPLMRRQAEEPAVESALASRTP